MEGLGEWFGDDPLIDSLRGDGDTGGLQDDEEGGGEWAGTGGWLVVGDGGGMELLRSSEGSSCSEISIKLSAAIKSACSRSSNSGKPVPGSGANSATVFWRDMTVEIIPLMRDILCQLILSARLEERWGKKKPDGTS
jgi:hypothetical protein